MAVAIPKDVPIAAPSELRSLRKVRDLKRRATLDTKEAFKRTLRYETDTQWVARPRGRKQMQQLAEIQRPYMQALAERSLNKPLKRTVAMRAPDGTTQWVEPARAEAFARSGLVLAKRPRTRPAHLVPKSKFRTPWPWENPDEAA